MSSYLVSITELSIRVIVVDNPSESIRMNHKKTKLS